MKNQTSSFLILIILGIMTVNSCKKDDNGPNLTKDIIGTWSIDYGSGADGGYMYTKQKITYYITENEIEVKWEGECYQISNPSNIETELEITKLAYKLLDDNIGEWQATYYNNNGDEHYYSDYEKGNFIFYVENNKLIINSIEESYISGPFYRVSGDKNEILNSVFNIDLEEDGYQWAESIKFTNDSIYFYGADENPDEITDSWEILNKNDTYLTAKITDKKDHHVEYQKIYYKFRGNDTYISLYSDELIKE
jgi:hypothetical protein